MNYNLSQFQISIILKLDISQSVKKARCTKCKSELLKEIFIGDFNNKLYLIEHCNNCNENYLVIYFFYKNKQKEVKK